MHNLLFKQLYDRKILKTSTGLDTCQIIRESEHQKILRKTLHSQCTSC